MTRLFHLVSWTLRFIQIVSCIELSPLGLNNNLLILYFNYSLISLWTLGLFPPFSYCDSCCCGHLCTNMCSRACSDFFWVYTQKWNTEPRRNSKVESFEDLPTVFHSAYPILDPHHNAQELQFLSILLTLVIFSGF